MSTTSIASESNFQEFDYKNLGDSKENRHTHAQIVAHSAIGESVRIRSSGERTLRGRNVTNTTNGRSPAHLGERGGLSEQTAPKKLRNGIKVTKPFKDPDPFSAKLHKVVLRRETRISRRLNFEKVAAELAKLEKTYHQYKNNTAPIAILDNAVDNFAIHFDHFKTEEANGTNKHAEIFQAISTKLNRLLSFKNSPRTEKEQVEAIEQFLNQSMTIMLEKVKHQFLIDVDRSFIVIKNGNIHTKVYKNKQIKNLLQDEKIPGLIEKMQHRKAMASIFLTVSAFMTPFILVALFYYLGSMMAKASLSQAIDQDLEKLVEKNKLQPLEKLDQKKLYLDYFSTMNGSLEGQKASDSIVAIDKSCSSFGEKFNTYNSLAQTTFGNEHQLYILSNALHNGHGTPSRRQLIIYDEKTRTVTAHFSVGLNNPMENALKDEGFQSITTIDLTNDVERTVIKKVPAKNL
ncbi:MAG: hypothetical protein AAGI90_03265 [Chlamydiota bacterium]